jgi:hypothetical protein
MLKYRNILLGRTDRTVRARTVSPLTRPYNTVYAVKYYVFAQILALRRPINVTLIQSDNFIRQVILRIVV